jgi:hypothetical protein
VPIRLSGDPSAWTLPLPLVGSVAAVSSTARPLTAFRGGAPVPLLPLLRSL